MVVSILTDLWKNLFKRPPTNRFPAKYKPASVSRFLKAVQEGRAKIISPLPVPEDFRGKLVYESDKCIGCQQCVRNCPSKAIIFKSEEKKIRIDVVRCIYCETCVEVCPVNCLSMSQEFLLATPDRKEKSSYVE